MDIVHELLKHNADVNARNGSGETALMVAAQISHVEIIQILETAETRGC